MGTNGVIKCNAAIPGPYIVGRFLTGRKALFVKKIQKTGMHSFGLLKSKLRRKQIGHSYGGWMKCTSIT